MSSTYVDRIESETQRNTFEHLALFNGNPLIFGVGVVPFETHPGGILYIVHKVPDASEYRRQATHEYSRILNRDADGAPDRLLRYEITPESFDIAPGLYDFSDDPKLTMHNKGNQKAEYRGLSITLQKQPFLLDDDHVLDVLSQLYVHGKISGSEFNLVTGKFNLMESPDQYRQRRDERQEHILAEGAAVEKAFYAHSSTYGSAPMLPVPGLRPILGWTL